jgi:DNA gyrase subunit A
LQRLDKGDHLADVVLVPPEAETDEDSEPATDVEPSGVRAADVVAEQAPSTEETSEPSAEG